MMFFAVSGAWQIFRLHERPKTAATSRLAIETLSHLHRAEKLEGPAGQAFRWLLLLASAIFFVSAAIGIVMALRLTRPRWLVALWLGIGVALPVLLFVAAQR